MPTMHACPSDATTSNEKNCVQCNIVGNDGCNACAADDADVCTGCNPKFYFDPDTTECVACSSNCSTCDSAVQCTVCATGFKLDGGTCVASDVIACDADNS
ncbi:Cysteine-rich protein [Spironucleus salmonicida]|uniref:Cysteine-rich protein n=1 Tax=Spironucleus salmonicida TaxID=348837 RepID=A0A9P8S0P1_9EUKA|nr:Cysteine-rich protein [Spironucleus salmonicida]